MPARVYASFILLAAALLLALAALTSAPGTGPALAQFPPGFTLTPTLFFTPLPTLTPTPLLTPPPTSAAPGCTTPLAIPIGSTVTVRPGVNIRYGPGASSPWLNNFPEPRNFIVVDGPVCDGGYYWWGVRGHGLTGWVAEGSVTLRFFTNIDDSAVAPDCPPPLNLVAGEVIELLTGVRIRQTPDLQGLVLTVAPGDSSAVVLDPEPVCANGYNWRFVRVEVVGVVYDGWMVEGSSSDPNLYYIEVTPGPGCVPPANLRIGERARVEYRDGNPKNLRLAPGTGAPILYTLVQNVPLEIAGGPVCVDGFNYWLVRVLASEPVVGWLAEGPRGAYWIRPIRPDSRYAPPPSETPTPAP